MKPDLLLLGTPITDEFSHQFMGLITPKDIDGNPNPYYDDVTNDDVPDGRVDAREGYIRAAYEEADETLALGRTLMGENDVDHLRLAPTTASRRSGTRSTSARCSSTSACRSASRAATAARRPTTPARRPRRHARQGVPRRRHLADLHQPGRARPGDRQHAAGPGRQYEAVRNQIIAAFQNLDDPNLPGQQQVVLKVLKKEELRNVDGTDSLHPSRSGDVVVVFRPPYQTDAQTPGQLVAPSQFFGQHGYLPDLVNLKRNINMHGTFIAAGPGIEQDDDPVTRRARHRRRARRWRT